jgi:hypothetical protein
VLALQHLIIVVPFGLLFMWLSWPYHIVLQTYHTSGGPLARLRTFIREVFTLGLHLVIPSIYLCCGSYAEVFMFSMTSNGWLLVQLLEQLPWPAGTTSKLFTLAQCRCPTAQLLVNVETAGDMGGLQLSARRRSSFALEGCVLASLADVDVQNKRRSDILLVWQKLWATGSDTGWLEVIETAHRAGQIRHQREIGRAHV